MNKAKLAELKKKVEGLIDTRGKGVSDLTREIENAESAAEEQRALMNKALHENNSNAYQTAETMRSMMIDRKVELEERRRAILRGTIIPAEDYDELKTFIEAESTAAATEERIAIKDHLEAIQQIKEDADEYYRELFLLADKAARANGISRYSGDWITVSKLPASWTEGILRDKYYFRDR